MQNALILGGSGRAGRHIQSALQANNWQTEGFDRQSDQLNEKARGKDVIIYAWNPPYPKWQSEYVNLTKMVIQAAENSGAAIFLPANVYVYGKAPAPWSDATPKNPCSSLGEIRVEIEEMLRESKAQTLIFRAGDFIDTKASGNWFDLILTSKLSAGKFTYPGAMDKAHSWAYLPDYARAATDLLEIRENLGMHQEVAFEGYTLTGEALCQNLERVMAEPLARKSMNWASIRLAAPFWPMGRRLLEMRYLWDWPHSLDGHKLRSLIPEFQATALQPALQKAIRARIHAQS